MEFWVVWRDLVQCICDKAVNRKIVWRSSFERLIVHCICNRNGFWTEYDERITSVSPSCYSVFYWGQDVIRVLIIRLRIPIWDESCCFACFDCFGGSMNMKDNRRVDAMLFLGGSIQWYALLTLLMLANCSDSGCQQFHDCIAWFCAKLVTKAEPRIFKCLRYAHRTNGENNNPTKIKQRAQTTHTLGKFIFM